MAAAVTNQNRMNAHCIRMVCVWHFCLLPLCTSISLSSIPFFCTLAYIFIYYLIISNAQKIISREHNKSAYVCVFHRCHFTKIFKGYGVRTIFSHRHVCVWYKYMVLGAYAIIWYVRGLYDVLNERLWPRVVNNFLRVIFIALPSPLAV